MRWRECGSMTIAENEYHELVQTYEYGAHESRRTDLPWARARLELAQRCLEILPSMPWAEDVQRRVYDLWSVRCAQARSDLRLHGIDPDA